MPNYPIQNNAFPDAYIIEIEDPIAGGINGADNKPNIALGTRTGYLQKHHSEFFKGTTVPSGSMGLTLTADSINKSLYFDETNANFYTLNSLTPSWKNLTKNTKMNVMNLHINNGIDEHNYASLERLSNYNVILRNNNAIKINLRVKTLYAGRIDSNTYTQVQVNSKELQVLSRIINQQQNTFGGFTTKNIPYNEQFLWREDWLAFSCQKNDNATYFDLHVLNFFINGASSGKEIDNIVYDTPTFEAIFTNLMTNEVVLDNLSPYKNVYIKKGQYHYQSHLVLSGDDFNITSSDGALIYAISTSGIIGYAIIGTTPIGPGIALWSDFISVTGNRNILKEHYDLRKYNFNIMDWVSVTGNDNEIEVFIEDGNVWSSASSDNLASRNIFNIREKNVKNDAYFSCRNISNSVISGVLDKKTTKQFNACTNNVFYGVASGINTIGEGNFDF